MDERVVVVGGGIGGLAAALAFARNGRPVTLLERDATVATRSADEAFQIERRGAPQSHQTHGFLARLVVLLRDRFPDVLNSLLDQGCITMPGTANLGEPQPGDEDMRVLIVRRTTLEWVLRSAVAAEPLVQLRAGTGFSGLSFADTPIDGVPVVDGVITQSAERVPAGMVVVGTGRRGDVPAWLAPQGIHVAEKVHESGLMYVSHWYKLPPGMEIALDPKLGGDLGFVKYLAVPGDGGTLSVTLAIRTSDRELRDALRTSESFEAACRALPGPDRFFAGPPLERLGEVRTMTGLINRIRRFTDLDGRPVVLGLHAVGDAHTCTNPLYGRGCSLALLQAVLLADADAAHPGDPAARSVAYEESSRKEVEPWWQISVQMDKAGADPAGFVGAAGSGEAAQGLAAVMVAAATDPVIGRGLARFWNLLATPADLMSDAQLLSRITEVIQRPDKYPVPEREGPTRDELLKVLTPEDVSSKPIPIGGK